MKYRHIVAFEPYGITSGDTDVELPLEASPYSGRLTGNVDPHLHPLDVATAHLFLSTRAFFGRAEGTSDPPGKRIDGEVERIRSERAKRNCRYLLLTRDGHFDEDPSLESFEAHGFVVFTDLSLEPLRAQLGSDKARAIACLAVVFPRLVGLRVVRDGIALWRDDGTPVLAPTFEAGGCFVSTGVLPEEVEQIRAASSSLHKKPLDAVANQLVQSLVRHDRPRDAFLAAWQGLENLIEALFPGVLKTIMADLARGPTHFWEHVGNVTNGRFTVRAKFSLVAFCLGGPIPSCETQTVRQAKRLRDEISHGSPVNDQDLPTTELRRLACKYLALHAGVPPVGASGAGNGCAQVSDAAGGGIGAREPTMAEGGDAPINDGGGAPTPTHDPGH